MFVETTVNPIDPASSLLENLAAAARGEGYTFMDRLLEEARSGENAFQNPGECFCGAYVGGALVGCGGVNHDPYVAQAAVRTIGRLRRVYVLTDFRRKGVAATLVRDLLRRSRTYFEVVRLRAPDQNASAFYEAIGFRRIADETATHVIEV